MKSLSTILIILGVILSLIGLYYKFVETASIYFHYALALGIIVFGFGILLSKMRKKSRN